MYVDSVFATRRSQHSGYRVIQGFPSSPLVNWGMLIPMFRFYYAFCKLPQAFSMTMKFQKYETAWIPFWTGYAHIHDHLTVRHQKTKSPINNFMPSINHQVQQAWKKNTEFRGKRIFLLDLPKYRFTLTGLSTFTKISTYLLCKLIRKMNVGISKFSNEYNKARLVESTLH